jgi:hypothetical protein
MKTKLLFLFLLILRITVYAQNTYVPDDNFEAHLEANGMGNGIANDDYVTTANISGITTLYVDGKSITDLTGIEGFTNLVLLICHTNQLTSLDMSSNLALEYLYCESNNLTNLNVSSNIVLKELQCNNNLLTNLDLNFNTDLYILECTNNQLTNLILNNNVNLRELSCSLNQFTSLDLSFNTALEKLNSALGQLTTLDLRANTLLTSLNCFANQLTKLDVRNGNNSSIAVFDSTSNPNLTCILVDDKSWSATNWTNIDPASTFVNDNAECAGVLSVSSNTFGSSFNVYPNPSNGVSKISLGATYAEVNLQVVDILGKVIDVQNHSNTNEVILNTESYTSGIYFIKVHSGSKSATIKLVVE